MNLAKRGSPAKVLPPASASPGEDPSISGDFQKAKQKKEEIWKKKLKKGVGLKIFQEKLKIAKQQRKSCWRSSKSCLKQL